MPISKRLSRTASQLVSKFKSSSSSSSTAEATPKKEEPKVDVADATTTTAEAPAVTVTPTATMLSPTTKLSSGYDMPLVGFGLWKVSPETCADTVYNAIKAGYRLFDGACGM